MLAGMYAALSPANDWLVLQGYDEDGLRHNGWAG
jgi:hypothetical protein